jgi:hypothetical protein
MPANLEDRLRLARPNPGGPTLAATAAARERALAALPRRSPRRRRLLGAVALVGAAAVALAFALRTDTEVASAAQVRAAVSGTLASATSLRGVLVIDRPEDDQASHPGVERWSFALNAAGDVRLTGLDSQQDLSYDGKRDVLRFSDGRWFTTISGFPPASGNSSVDWLLQHEIGSVITALSAEPDAQVQEVQYEGRPSWLLTVRADLADGNGTAERDIVVDRALGLPVHDVVKNAGTVLGDWRLENLTVDDGLPPSAFALEPRPGQEVRTEDEGSRRIAADEIERTAGYVPLLPTWLPDGYRLDHAAVSPSYSAAGTPGPENVVSFLYRRGLEQLTVTMRPHDESGAIAARPVARPFCTARSLSVFICANVEQTVHSRPVKLVSGALAGETGRLRIDVAAPPTLTVETPELDVQITGDADGAELTRIASSLER